MVRKSPPIGWKRKKFKALFLHRRLSKFLWAGVLLGLSIILLFYAAFKLESSATSPIVIVGSNAKINEAASGLKDEGKLALSEAPQEETPIAHSQNLERLTIRLVRTMLIYITIFVSILGFRYLYEEMRESFFIGVISVLAVVIFSGDMVMAIISYFFEEYSCFAQRICLFGSLISFGFASGYFLGFHPMSARVLIKAVRRYLIYDEIKNSDWVQEGNRFLPIEVMPMDFVPQNLEYLRDTRSLKIEDVLIKFFRGTYNKKKQKDVLILIGGFGSGKSTALCENVLLWLESDMLHSAEIPVYVKLRDWLDDDDLDYIYGTKQQDKKGRLFDDATSLNRICQLLTGKQEDNKETNALLNVLTSLHEERKLVYIFDGFNELLQRKHLSNQGGASEQFARNLSAFLENFVSGNRCIISTCEMPGVITDRSLLMNRYEDKYLIYAIKGVALTKKQTDEIKMSARWKKRLVSSVALYRLADSEPKGKGGLSTYCLLERYVNKQVEREFVTAKGQKEYKKSIEDLIKDHLSNQNKYLDVVANPYAGLSFSNSSKESSPQMDRTRLFYRSTDRPNVYHPSHILIYQFFLAQYIKNMFFGGKEKTDMFCDFFGTDEPKDKPNVLKFPHLKAAFIMALTEVFLEERRVEENKKRCKKYFLDLMSKNKKCINGFLLLISQINDDVYAIDKKRPLSGLLANSLTEQLEEMEEESQDSELPVRLALLKLFDPESKSQKEKMKKLLKDSLKKQWTYLGIQREVLDYWAELFRGKI